MEQIIKALRPYIENGYKLEQSYTLGEEDNKWEINNDSKTIYLSFKTLNNEIGLKLYNKIKRALKAEILESIIVEGLHYDNALSLLYTHYPYGPDDNSNCVLLGNDREILAIQYNGMKTTRFIQANEVMNQNGGVVWNNKKLIKGTYFAEEVNGLINGLKRKLGAI